MRDKYNRVISVGQHIKDREGMVYEAITEDDGLKDTRILLREVRYENEDPDYLAKRDARNTKKQEYLLSREAARNMWIVSKEQ